MVAAVETVVAVEDVVGPEELSRKWNIGLEMAKATLDVTTQHGV
jgi:hypothetical protein